MEIRITRTVTFRTIPLEQAGIENVCFAVPSNVRCLFREPRPALARKL